MSGETARNMFEGIWAEADRRHREMKDSHGALFELFEAYRQLDADERTDVDGLLAERLDSDIETFRFDAVALIQEFRIQSAAPDLVRLEERLQREDTPGARFERAKVLRVLRILETRS